jgi:hypothetical protein
LISDITNFSISGGYDISVTNNSGLYTIASTNLVHTDSQQPQGFVNRTDSRISVSGNIFRIEPTGSSYSYYNKGIKVVKTSGNSLTIPNLTQINYIHFDTINNQLSNKTTSFDFSSDIPIAYVAWNSGVGPSGQMTFFAEERHGIVMDTSTHKWIHNTFGAQYVEGLSIGNYSTSGNGSNNSDATIAIGNGTLYQEDIEINITDSSSTDPFCQELDPIAQIPVYYHEGSTGQWVKNAATNYPVKYGANGPQYNLLTGGTWSTPDVSPGGATRYFAVWILATNQIDDPIISIMGQRVDSNPGSAESNNSWSDVNLTNLPLSEVKPLYRLIFAGDSDYTNVPKCRLLSILDIRASVISTIAGVSQNDHGSLFGLGDDDHSQYLHVDNNRTVNAVHNFVNGLTSNGLINSTSGNFNSLSVSGISVSTIGASNINANNRLTITNDTLGTEMYLEAASTSSESTRIVFAGYNAPNGSIEADESQEILNFVGPWKLNNSGISVEGHTHTASNITNFNSSVSGLLPVGTLNYVSKFGTGGSGLGNSLIFDNGTNVGIGTTSPTSTLQVSGLVTANSGIFDNISFTSPILSSGSLVSFTHPDNSGSSVYDAIISGQLHITRGANGGIYNLATEASWNQNLSPSGTLWNNDGWSNIVNFPSRTYSTLYSAVGGQLGYNLPNAELIMKHVPTNRYWKVKFTSWTQGGGGGFVYERQEIFLNNNDPININRNTNIDGNLTATLLSANSLSTTGISCQQLSVNGEDLTYGGQFPSINLKGYAWFGKVDGSIGIACANNTSGTFSSTSDFYTFTGINENVSVYTPICFTAGYSAQVYMHTNGNVGINTTTPDYKLDVNGTANIATSLRINAQTASTIASFNSSKNIVSLSTDTYPSLTELSYVKGVTSAIQTQLNGKQATLTNPVTGTGAANHIAYWTGTNAIAHDSSSLYWDATNNRLGINTNAPTVAIDADSNTIRLRTARTIATSTTTGAVGEICWDSNYIYVCTATNTWKRASLGTW